MNQINWKVRMANKTFWLSLIPAVLLLVQVVASVFGFTLDLGELGNKLLEVVNALFAVLAILFALAVGAGMVALGLYFYNRAAHVHLQDWEGKR